MLIPIGHEETKLRRFPVLTLLLIAACTALFVQTWLSYRGFEEETSQARHEVWSYFEKHPYLTIDPATAEALFPDIDEAARNLRIQQVARTYPHKVFEFQVSMDQPELDRRSQALLAVVQKQILLQWGLVTSAPTVKAYFGHMFLHAGWMHLIGNMVFLFLAGYILEEVWGRPIFLGLYVLSGLVSAAFFSFMYPNLSIPLVGASGAVAGLMGAFMVRFWSTKIRFWYWLLFLFRGTFAAPAWLMLGLYFGNEVFSGWMMDQLADPENGGVAHWAHVGGFAFGFVTAVAIRISGIEARYLHPALEAKVTYAENPEIDKALEHKANGELDHAFALARLALQKESGNPVAAMALWDIAKELGKVADVAPLLVNPIRKDIQSGRTDAALKQLKELWNFAPDTSFDPLSLVRLGAQLAECGKDTEATFILERALPPGDAPLAAPVALRLAKAAQGIDPHLAARAANSALAAADVDPALRGQLEAIVKAAPAAPAPKPEAPAADSIDHSSVELSSDEDTAAPELGAPEDGTSDLFDHGAVDLASDDDAGVASSGTDAAADAFDHGVVDLASDDEAPPAVDAGASDAALEFGNEIDLDADDDEGGAGFLSDPELDKDSS